MAPLSYLLAILAFELRYYLSNWIFMRTNPMRSPESLLQEQVCQWLRLQHPGVLFHSDYGSGLKMTKINAILQKKMQKTRAWPDMFIAEPRGPFCGLFLELKHLTSSEVLRDGTMGNSEHVREQRVVLEMLQEKGYQATFAIGFDQAQELINSYLTTSAR